MHDVEIGLFGRRLNEWLPYFGDLLIQTVYVLIFIEQLRGEIIRYKSGLALFSFGLLHLFKL